MFFTKFVASSISFNSLTCAKLEYPISTPMAVATSDLYPNRFHISTIGEGFPRGEVACCDVAAAVPSVIDGAIHFLMNVSVLVVVLPEE